MTGAGIAAADADRKARLAPRVFYFRRKKRRKPVLVWTDAMWKPSAEAPARIGFVVFVPSDDDEEEDGEGARPRGTWYHSSLVVPADFMRTFVERKQYIGQLELLGAVAVYYSAPELFRDRRVIHFIDNASALASIVKGYSSAADSARIVHSFWALICGLAADAWFFFVPSEANVADWPSRGDLSYVEGVLGSSWLDTKLPPIESWGSVLEALAAAAAAPSRAADSASRRGRKRRP